MPAGNRSMSPGSRPTAAGRRRRYRESPWPRAAKPRDRVCDSRSGEGVYRTYVADVERGQRDVGLVNVDRLASALSADLPELKAAPESRFVR